MRKTPPSAQQGTHIWHRSIGNVHGHVLLQRGEKKGRHVEVEYVKIVIQSQHTASRRKADVWDAGFKGLQGFLMFLKKNECRKGDQGRKTNIIKSSPQSEKVVKQRKEGQQGEEFSSSTNPKPTCQGQRSASSACLQLLLHELCLLAIRQARMASWGGVSGLHQHSRHQPSRGVMAPIVYTAPHFCFHPSFCCLRHLRCACRFADQSFATEILNAGDVFAVWVHGDNRCCYGMDWNPLQVCLWMFT